MTASDKQFSMQLTSWGAPLQPATGEIPTPTGTQVVLKVLAAGLCHSDLHIIDGYFSLGGDAKLDLGALGLPLPLTLGHETCGQVIAIGPDVAHQKEAVKIGDKGIVYPWIGCGKPTCLYCSAGDEELCPNHGGAPLGTASHGGMSTHILVPHPKYVVDYGNIPDDVACTYACSGVTAMGAIKKFDGDISPKDKLLIIGAGGVGFSGIKIAESLYGPDSVIVSDIDDNKLKQCQALGMQTVNSLGEPEAIIAKVMELSGGGVTGAVDFVGNPATFALGNGALRKGGKQVIVGLFGGAAIVPIPLLPLRAITIQGSYVGNPTHFKELVELGKQGKLHHIPVATRPLSEAQSAVDDLRGGKVVGRIVLKP